MSSAQRGNVMLGIWLVALGGVVLVQQATGLSWGRAWPLFLVMAGIGTGGSALVAMVGRRVAPWSLVWSLIWPLLLIAVGVLLFLDLGGYVDIDALELLSRWWPLALIAVGLLVIIGAVWPRGRAIEDVVEVPLGGATAGDVVLKFGAGILEVFAGPPGQLVSGTFEGGAHRRELGPGRVELASDIVSVWPFGDRFHWRVGLAPDVPLRLRVEGGASKGTLDLSGLQVTHLELKTGASDTRVVLPAGVDRAVARIEAGAAQVRIEVPAGVAARIRSRMGLGSTAVDERRFPRSSNGWASPDLAAAERQVEIDITGGVGSVHVS